MNWWKQGDGNTNAVAFTGATESSQTRTALLLVAFKVSIVVTTSYGAMVLLTKLTADFFERIESDRFAFVLTVLMYFVCSFILVFIDLAFNNRGFLAWLIAPFDLPLEPNHLKE